VYGAMVFGCDQPDAFTDEHVELMSAIGTQSALSLQNPCVPEFTPRKRENRRSGRRRA